MLGLTSQQGAWGTVVQWASDSGTWAAQMQISPARNFLYKHAYRSSSRPHLQRAPATPRNLA